jgi:hypothetical protein
MSPWAAGLGQGALSAGLSAYGNVAEENDRSKGDQRMILESALAALGAGMAGFKMRKAMNGNAAHIIADLKQQGQVHAPKQLAALRSAYQNSSLLKRLSPEQWLNLGATTAAAGLGSSVGGGMVAPFVADQLGLVGVPGSWTRRANDWNWDRQIPLEQAIAAEIARRAQTGEVAP